MAIVFVVGSNCKANAVAQNLYKSYNIEPVRTRRWEHLLCHLAHGESYDEIERDIRLQKFTLYYGYPWSHVGCEIEMRRRFPESIWVNASEVECDTSNACTNEDCNFEDTAIGSAGPYTTVGDLAYIFDKRADGNRPFPCMCTLLNIVDKANVWSGGDYASLSSDNLSCFVPLTIGAAEDVRIYIDWAHAAADPEMEHVNVAWIAESPTVVPGCIDAVKNVAHNFKRVLNGGTDTPFGRVPFGAGWIPFKDIIAAKTCPKMPIASLILSPKKWAEGHALRHHIREVFSLDTRIVPAGSGTLHPLDNKAEALNPYMYSIIIENCRTCGYWTEKLVDCLTCRCIAFYWGAPDVHEWFHPGSVICFDTVDQLRTLLHTMTAEDYSARQVAIDYNWHRAQARRCNLNNLAFDTDLPSFCTSTTSCTKIDSLRGP